MIASYTANLAAFLTVETLERPIESASDLANQNEIYYGAVSGGSTAGFFARSDNDVYQRLHVFMSGVHQSEVMMGGNIEGVEKVEEADGKYAFFMESAAIDYLVERRCKLSQVGGLLDSKGYGIASRKGTPYKDYLDHAILKLMEGGVLHKLKIKWWKQKRGGGACQAQGGGGGVSPLGLSNVAGVFLVTLAGCGMAVVFAIIEFLYGTRKSSQDAGVSWVEEMTTELKFIFKCHGNTKKVRCKEEDNTSNNSQSSHLSCEDSPPYSRRKSAASKNGFIYKNNIAVTVSVLILPVSPVFTSLVISAGVSVRDKVRQIRAEPAQWPPAPLQPPHQPHQCRHRVRHRPHRHQREPFRVQRGGRTVND